MEKLEQISETLRNIFPNAESYRVTISSPDKFFDELHAPDGFECQKSINEKREKCSGTGGVMYVINGVSFNILNKSE